jgi:hypothetical protein
MTGNGWVLCRSKRDGKQSIGPMFCQSRMAGNRLILCSAKMWCRAISWSCFLSKRDWSNRLVLCSVTKGKAGNLLYLFSVSKRWQAISWSCCLSGRDGREWLGPVFCQTELWIEQWSTVSIWKEVLSKSNRISLLLIGKLDKNYLYIYMYIL